MKIEEIIGDKNDHAKVQIKGASIPVKSLRTLINEGFIQIKPNVANKSFFLWGKNCSACLTLQKLLDRGKG